MTRILGRSHVVTSPAVARRRNSNVDSAFVVSALLFATELAWSLVLVAAATDVMWAVR